MTVLFSGSACLEDLLSLSVELFESQPVIRNYTKYKLIMFEDTFYFSLSNYLKADLKH